ncbi:DUF6445 family protein [Aliikangiella sp. IMCC44359]|uniref:DUF6445 family protein n=1 Tax=Aliikangiella sp. IMCC44359 TaxID=3459125 RepID=UPI00403ADF28
MFSPMPDISLLPDVPINVPSLSFEPLEQGSNYWIKDDFFPVAKAKQIANRCFNHKKWKLGYPYTKEKWPGMRVNKALKIEELNLVENWVKVMIGRENIWVEKLPGKSQVSSNTAQLVGKNESGALPHTDSRTLSRYAALIYLNLNPSVNSGTSFYRLRYPNGAAGGNMVCNPYDNLSDALKVQTLPPEAWYEDLRIENRFNRIILYKSNLVHSASGYFGESKRDKRLTAVFFWMCD